MWGAAWLYRATNMTKYLDYPGGVKDSGGARTEFSWDDKYVGAQVLCSKGIIQFSQMVFNVFSM